MAQLRPEAQPVEECATCRYGRVDMAAGADPEYHCHRYPPVVIALRITNPGDADAEMAQTWPEVMANDWCGEWAPESPATGRPS